MKNRYYYQGIKRNCISFKSKNPKIFIFRIFFFKIFNKSIIIFMVIVMEVKQLNLEALEQERQKVYRKNRNMYILSGILILFGIGITFYSLGVLLFAYLFCLHLPSTGVICIYHHSQQNITFWSRFWKPRVVLRDCPPSSGRRLLQIWD